MFTQVPVLFPQRVGGLILDTRLMILMAIRLVIFSVGMSRPSQGNDWTYSITKKYNNGEEYRTNFGVNGDRGNFQ